jgi:tRNA dimethylallyltransferase
VICGPTGTGKSELALRIAETAGGEIVNYDSVQIYRGFDIGSAKPSPEVRARVPHHLFDIADATDEFNAADFGRLARTTCAAIDSRDRRAVLAGGTFFYLRAFLRGLPEMPPRDEAIRTRIARVARTPGGPERLHRWLSKIDPRSGKKIALADRHRVERALEVWITTRQPISSWDAAGGDELSTIKIGLRMERQQLVERLNARVAAMYERGLIAETRALLETYPATARPFGAIGYAEAVRIVGGSLTVADAIAETQRRTRAYAKRQMTWLRAERNVQWIDVTTNEETFAAAMRLIEEND